MGKCKYLSLCVLMLYTGMVYQTCLALQSLSLADNQTQRITIAAQELSRIFVKGDLIVNVRGLEGAYILTKDALQGQIFIKPTAPYQKKSFNLFISTQQGHNYNLIATASEVPGQDIELKPATPSKVAAVWEQASDYMQLITKLMLGMLHDKAPDGYGIVYPSKKHRVIKYADFTVTLQQEYRGHNLCGEVLLITNRRNYAINLAEHLFFQLDTRAIAILDPVVPAKGITKVLRINAEVRHA